MRIFPEPIPREFPEGFPARNKAGGATWLPTSEDSLVSWYDYGLPYGLSPTDPILTYTDLAGNHNQTGDAAKRPVWNEDILNGLGGALFDSINDCLYTPSYAWGTGKATIGLVVSSIPSGGDRMLCEFSPAASSNSGGFMLLRNSGNTATCLMRMGVANSNCVGTTTITTGAHLLVATFDSSLGTDWAQLYVDGTAEGVHLNNDPLGGSFGTYSLNMGSRNNGASLPSGAYIHEGTLFNDRLDPTDLTNYMMGRWGL